MQTAVMQELYRMVDKYAVEESLNRLLKQFIHEKEAESFFWSDLTRYTHFILNGDSKRINGSAALTELVVLLSDIVDDLQDQDSLDRPWMKSDPAVTLNAILALFATIVGEMGEHPSAAVVTGGLLARSIHGQQWDITNAVRTEEDYFAMVERKSGSLLQFALYMGYSLVEGLSSDIKQTLEELGNCVGIAAQIENDVKDVLRFDLKNDLLRKKRTLPILYLLEDSREECPDLERFYDGELSEEEFLGKKTEILSYVRDSGCVEYCQVIQTLYVDRARELYRLIPVAAPWADQFEKLVFR